MLPRTTRVLPFILAASVLAGLTANAALIPAEIVLKDGDVVGFSTVSSLNAPFTDGQGRVGFVVALVDNQRAIWWNDGPVFFSGDALPDQLTGGEGTMGVSDTGGFIYSPAFNGLDAVYTHGGKLLAEDDVCPPLPDLYSSFNSRPTMLPDGTAFWIAGTTETPGGSSTNRHLFTAPDPTDPASIVRVLGGGDTIEGKTVDPSNANFDYWISNNGLHHIQMLEMMTAQPEHLYLDGGFVAQEGDPTGQGDAWANFDIVAVNDDGDYIFTGDTDGPTSTDEYLAYNGSIVVREGDTLDGVLLASGYALRAASINNLGQVAHSWGSGSSEVLFFGSAEDLQGSIAVLANGDEIDIDDDDIADYVVTDLNASAAVGPGLDLAADGFVYVEVDLEPVGGGQALEAILRIFIDPTAAVQELSVAEVTGLRAYPNPSRGPTELRLSLPKGSATVVAVFDASGRRIRTLTEGWCPGGEMRIDWDGRDEKGMPVPAGIYFVRSACDFRVEMLRLTLLR